MDPAKRDRLIAGIYEAAVDSRRWNDALIALADVVGCAQTSLEFYDRRSGCMKGYNPYSAPEHIKSYVEYWLPTFPHWHKTRSFPVGRLIRRSDVMDVEAVVKLPFYNEWMKPQGIGGDTRFANLATNSRANARLTAFKPWGAARFTPTEDRLLEAISAHCIRALGIHRQLRMAEAKQALLLLYGGAPEGFLIVDSLGGILGVDPATHRRLIAAGLLSAAGPQGRLRMDNPALERLISGASRRDQARPVRAGQVEHRGPDGVLLKITIIPLVPDPALIVDPWLAIDRPAALLHVATPADAARERVSRLIEDYGLTPAEASVAIETAKGDGRAAVGARLGIRETTVRSHLSTIFDKLGIHRQAELTRIVSGG